MQEAGGYVGLRESVGRIEGETVGDLDGYGEGDSVCSLVPDDPPPQAQHASEAVFPKFSNESPCF